MRTTLVPLSILVTMIITLLAYDCYTTLAAERDDWRRTAKEAIQQRSSLNAQLRHSEISRKKWISDFQKLKDSRDRLKENCKEPK